MAKSGTRLKKGESSPTMLHAEFVNDSVLEPLEALLNMTVSPAGLGKLVRKGARAVLQLDGIENGKISGYVMVNGELRSATIQGTIGAPV